MLNKKIMLFFSLSLIFLIVATIIVHGNSVQAPNGEYYVKEDGAEQTLTYEYDFEYSGGYRFGDGHIYFAIYPKDIASICGDASNLDKIDKSILDYYVEFKTFDYADNGHSGRIDIVLPDDISSILTMVKDDNTFDNDNYVRNGAQKHLCGYIIFSFNEYGREGEKSTRVYGNRILILKPDSIDPRANYGINSRMVLFILAPILAIILFIIIISGKFFQ